MIEGNPLASEICERLIDVMEALGFDDLIRCASSCGGEVEYSWYVTKASLGGEHSYPFAAVLDGIKADRRRLEIFDKAVKEASRN
jgi:hypothetical protein